MKTPGRLPILLLWLAIALAVSFGCVLAFDKASIGWFSNPESHQLVLQFLLITAVGGGVALLLRFVSEQRERDREQHQRAIENERAALEQKRQLLNPYYEDLVRTYHEVERISRRLRAKSRPDGTDRRVIDRIDYENQMIALQDLELRLVQVVREINIQPDLFGPYGASIEAKLEKAEEYLRNVVRDYELGEHISPVQPGLVPLPRHVYEFIAQRDERKANRLRHLKKEHFRAPILDVRRTIVSIMNRP